MKMYMQYCSNLREANIQLQRLRETNAAFAEFETSVKLPLEKLESYLIMPVQRIPRYILLLEDLIKHTPPENYEHESLISALRAVKQSAEYLNLAVSTNENLNKVFQIATSLGGECVVCFPLPPFLLPSFNEMILIRGLMNEWMDE